MTKEYDFMKTTWNKITLKEVNIPEKQMQFLKEIDRISRKYNLSISHEDEHGAFIIEKYSDRNIEWLKNADINY